MSRASAPSQGSPAVKPVQNALTVIMTLKSPEAYQELCKSMADPHINAAVAGALEAIGTVHFARFFFLENNTKFAIVTTYDGDFETYVREFTTHIGKIFDVIHSFMVDHPPFPVQEHPKEFIEYIRAHNITPVTWYSAYPTKTVMLINSID